MKRLSLTLMSVFLLSPLAVAETVKNCEHYDTLVAQYSITKSKLNHKQEVTNETSNQMTLLRDKNQVSHDYIGQPWVPTWRLLNSGHIAKTDFYPKQKQCIEYEPNKVKNSLHNWQEKFQLVADDSISEMKLVSRTGANCNILEEYELHDGDSHIELQWWPKQNLMKHYNVATSHGQQSWDLSNVELKTKKSKKVFKQYDDYTLTDYADIGDNETDPFLRSMIHLGFTH